MANHVCYFYFKVTKVNRTELTDETENFFRYAQLVLADVPNNLRDLFKHELGLLPGNSL